MHFYVNLKILNTRSQGSLFYLTSDWRPFFGGVSGLVSQFSRSSDNFFHLLKPCWSDIKPSCFLVSFPEYSWRKINRSDWLNSTIITCGSSFHLGNCQNNIFQYENFYCAQNFNVIQYLDIWIEKYDPLWLDPSCRKFGIGFDNIWYSIFNSDQISRLRPNFTNATKFHN